MNSGWKAFLEQAGARFDGDRVSGYGAPTDEARLAVEGDVVADLSHLGVARVGGEDAVSFLQGQFTSDVRQVTEAHSQIGGYCSPKGRLLAIFRLFRHGSSLHLRLPMEMQGALIKRLGMFVLMSKVQLEDVSETLVRFGASGPGMGERLAGALGAVPEEVDGTVHASGVTVMRVPGPHPRFELYGSRESLEPLWRELSAGAAPVGPDAWALLDIRSGQPTVYAETVEAFVPQMVNMQALDGVSFRKGCYTGQEVVARMQYLGQLKRRMYQAHVDADHRPAPGLSLFSPMSASGQGAGKVVDARPAPDGGHDLLAVVQIEATEQGEVFLEDGDGPKLQFRPLPYGYEAPDAPAASEH
jgi:folate-binding protein YgfZ